MNDNDFNELVKKAQSMISNNQVPPEITAMMQNINLNSQNQNNKKNNNSHCDSNNNAKSNSSPYFNGNNISDDNISNLLEALRPYMRDSKKEKIDEYIKLVRMGKAAKLFNMLNNNK